MTRIARFRSIPDGYTVIRTEADTKNPFFNDYARISGWVDVEFPDLTTDEVSAELAHIDAETAKIEQRHAKQTEALDKRRSELEAMFPQDRVDDTDGFPELLHEFPEQPLGLLGAQ